MKPSLILKPPFKRPIDIDIWSNHIVDVKFNLLNLTYKTTPEKKERKKASKKERQERFEMKRKEKEMKWRQDSKQERKKKA